jgi:hypothetical protein
MCKGVIDFIIREGVARKTLVSLQGGGIKEIFVFTKKPRKKILEVLKNGHF